MATFAWPVSWRFQRRRFWIIGTAFTESPARCLSSGETMISSSPRS